MKNNKSVKHPISSQLLLGSLISAALAGSSVARAETVGPVVYGRANVVLEQRDLESTTPDQKQWELNSHNSRLGFKGSSTLDNQGVSLVYQLEYELNVDDGAAGNTAFSQRNTFVGLQGAWGEIRGGKFDTPLKTAEGKVDQFNDLQGDIDALIGGQNRPGNIVQFISPKIANGLVVNAAFIPAEGTDVDADDEPDDGFADTLSLSAVFENTNFYAALAWDQNQAARRTVDGIGQGDLVRLVGGWKGGAFETGVLLQQTSDARANNDAKDTSYLVSGAYKLGSFKYKAQYGLSEGEVSAEEGTLFALGADYNLSQKTALYLYLASLDKDLADTTDQTLGLGLVHSF